MCECEGTYKCWTHFRGLRPVTTSLIMEFEAQLKLRIIKFDDTRS